MSQSISQFCQSLSLDNEQLAIDRNPQFAFKVPDTFQQQIESGNPNDPLLKQVLPLLSERDFRDDFPEDPVADLAYNPTPSLIHKYQGRALLIASPKCDIHCRYCFRRHFPYQEQVNQRHWQQALDYITVDDSIHEVILSGGDPMSLSENALMALIEKIEAIEHVETLRIHSRTPIAAPERAPQDAFITWAKQTRLHKVMVVHCNHANELSELSQSLLRQYKQVGFHLLNQSVLLKGVNDSVEALTELSRKLFEQGVLPYYLNQLDQVAGSAHFLVDPKTAIKLHLALREQLPGYLLPQLVKDIAGKPYKSALA